MLPRLPTVERVFCCFPLTVGSFMIAVGELVLASLRIALIYLDKNTCTAFEDKYLLYTCLVNVRYFCDELREYERFSNIIKDVGKWCRILFIPFFFLQRKPMKRCSCWRSS